MSTLKTSFDKAFEFTVGNEGGFSNDKSDHGGPTRFGITQYDAEMRRGRHVTLEEMKVFPLEEAKQIYQAKYWAPLRLDGVSSPAVAMVIFDSGVLNGIHTAALYAQRACVIQGQTTLTRDGIIGPKTIQALNGVDHKMFINQFVTLLVNRFEAIAQRAPSQRVFLQGWLNRAHRLFALA